MQVLSFNPLVQKQAHGESAKLVVQKLVTILFRSNSNPMMSSPGPVCAKQTSDEHHVAM